MPFDIYLIRHPKPDIAAGVCYGEMDMPPVTSHLHEVIDFVQGKLPMADLKHYSSPLQRARLVAEGVGHLHCITPELAEMSFGNWEGTRWDDIPRTDMNAWRDNFLHYNEHGGESVSSFYSRVEQFINRTLLPEGNDAVIFAHAGIIRSFLHYTGDVPLSQGNTIDLDYGSINHLHYNGQQLKAVRTNITE